MEEKNENKSKVAKIFSIISMVFLVFCVSILIYSTISYSKSGLVNFFGYSFHAIQTESMEPEINVGDLVIVKKVPYSEINVGDDILFKCEDTTSRVYGQYIVHRVKEFTTTEGVYITYGINNSGIPDKVPSKAEGKVVVVSSTFGSIFLFVTNSRNLIMLIGIVCLLIFTFLQLCSVIANASKLKEEKAKEKMQNDVELQEKIKKELLDEMKNKDNKEQKSNNLDEKNIDAVTQQDAPQADTNSSEGDTQSDEGGEDK